MQKSNHGQPTIKSIIEHLKHEHQAKQHEKDEQRKHAQFMREAEEKKVLAEQEILAAQKKAAEKQTQHTQNSPGLIAQILKKADQALAQSNFDKQKTNLEAEINNLIVECQQLVYTKEFAAALAKYELAVAKTDLLNTEWISLQKSLENSIFTNNYDLAKQYRKQLEELIRQAKDLQRSHALKLEWEELRICLHPTDLFERAEFGANDAKLLQDLQAMHRSYCTHKPYLSAEENIVLDKLQTAIKNCQAEIDKIKAIESRKLALLNQEEARKSEIKRNNNHHAAAITMLEQLPQFIQNGDIPHAANLLDSTKNHLMAITNFSDIPSHIRIDMHIIDSCLTTMHQQLANFKINANQHAIASAKKVLQLVVANPNTPMGADKLIYSRHKQILCDKIEICFKQHWVKFNNREIPDSLLEQLAATIEPHVKIIGYKKWLVDMFSANVSIHEIEKRLAEIDLVFKAYVAAENSPYIMLPISTSTLRFNQQIPMAIEVANDEESLIKAASAPTMSC